MEDVASGRLTATGHWSRNNRDARDVTDQNDSRIRWLFEWQPQ